MGTCSLGMIDGIALPKHVICICRYVRNKDSYAITCKTTTKKHDKLWPGEFIVEDLFGKGPSKVNPLNIFRVRKEQLDHHKWVGRLDDSILPSFKLGISLAIKGKKLTPAEILVVADSWEPFFT